MKSIKLWSYLPLVLWPITVFGQVEPQDLQYCRDLKDIVEKTCTSADQITRAECIVKRYDRDHAGCSGINLKTKSGTLACIEEFNTNFNQGCVLNSPSRLAAESTVADLLALIEGKFLIEQGPLKAELANERLRQDKVLDLLNRYNGLAKLRASDTEVVIAASLKYKDVYEKWATRLNELLIQANALSSVTSYQSLYLEVKDIQLSSKKEMNVHRGNLIRVKAKNKVLERQFYEEVANLGAGETFEDNVLSLNSEMLDLVLNEIKEAKFTLDRHVDYVLLMLGAKRNALMNIQNSEEFNNTIQTALYLQRSQSYLGQMNTISEKIVRPEESSFFDIPYQKPIYEASLRLKELHSMCISGGKESWHSLGCNAVALQQRRANAMLNSRIENEIRFSMTGMVDNANPGRLAADKEMITTLLENGDLKNASALFDTLLERYGD